MIKAILAYLKEALEFNGLLALADMGDPAALEALKAKLANG